MKVFYDEFKPRRDHSQPCGGFYRRKDWRQWVCAMKSHDWRRVEALEHKAAYHARRRQERLAKKDELANGGLIK